MNWLTYSKSQYPKHREAFFRTPDVDEWVCNCDRGRLQSRMDAIADEMADSFSINLFLESLLKHGVSRYASEYRDRYAQIVPADVVVEAHGTDRTVFPHHILSGVWSWNGPTLSLLRDAVHELLPAWACAFDRLTQPGLGALVLAGLARDRDFRAFPYEPNLDAARAVLTEALDEVILAVSGRTIDERLSFAWDQLASSRASLSAAESLWSILSERYPVEATQWLFRQAAKSDARPEQIYRGLGGFRLGIEGGADGLLQALRERLAELHVIQRSESRDLRRRAESIEALVIGPSYLETVPRQVGRTRVTDLTVAAVLEHGDATVETNFDAPGLWLGVVRQGARVGFLRVGLHPDGLARTLSNLIEGRVNLDKDDLHDLATYLTRRLSCLNGTLAEVRTEEEWSWVVTMARAHGVPGRSWDALRFRLKHGEGATAEKLAVLVSMKGSPRHLLHVVAPRGPRGTFLNEQVTETSVALKQVVPDAAERRTLLAQWMGSAKGRVRWLVRRCLETEAAN